MPDRPLSRARRLAKPRAAWHDPRMGRSRILAVSGLVVAPLLAGCGERSPALHARDSASRLVIEVGGDGRKLGELLRASSATPGAGPRPVSPADPTTLSDGPVREYREVLLEPGQTLSQLCAAQLGDAGRWREVAKLNGWSDEQIARLPARQVVLLPPF